MSPAKIFQGNGPTKTEEVSKEKKVEEGGADGIKKTEEISKEKKVEEGGADGIKKTEEVSKEKKVVEEGGGGDGAKKTEEISKQKKVEETGPGNSAPEKASTEPQTPDEKAAAELITDETWDADRKRLVDGVFLVVGFLPKLMNAVGKSDDRGVIDQSFRSGLMHDIVTDVIKLENQLPLGVLLDVSLAVHDAVDATLRSVEFKDVMASVVAGHKMTLITTESFGEVVRKFCWYYSPFLSKKPQAADKGVAIDAKMMAERTLLDCLHQSVVPAPPASGARATGRPSRMPAARELKRSGIRVQASETGRAEIEFKEQWSSVRLPALAYDFKLATVARNLLAREYEEQSKPVTRYFQMMNELVEDVVDARILRRAGVLRAGASVDAQEVYGLIKNIDGHATYPSVYMAMDREIETVKKHHEMRMNNFFVRNRPGVIWASSVAAISVVAIVAARKIRG
ncbi:hypothetical protein PR202_ga18072 [Eleusine coracana subsp. coracana]|uniref:Transmembrane protein n=1 Tax=Eleusine coracana subsp. coracana TaxID=191504 RepID=A0AAV5CRI5_ELECO|nr:hypothetical protein PR202_ga18072 [Eleusine coracana subsp. coracana]